MKRPASYPKFFSAAFGDGRQPYEYQVRLACGERDGRDLSDWQAGGQPCASRLIDIPTGLGKTAAVTLAWLWNRVALGDPAWPRRLVYCLPMRTLVEQTAGAVEDWVQRLAQEVGGEDLNWLRERSPIVLMGGEDTKKGDWDLYPEKPAILVGTQDMLLSRALNRGYGMSRYRWPMHFALLNNDCLWVMDEVQLMGAGLAATTQMVGFRSMAGLGARRSHPWWMSATIRPDWLETVELGLCQDSPFAGQPSWAERALDLRDALGPFLLAFLETLLRAANTRGSMGESSPDRPSVVEEPGPAPAGSPLSPQELTLAQEIAADGISIQDRFRPEPLYKQTGKGFFESRTVEDIQDVRRETREER